MSSLITTTNNSSPRLASQSPSGSVRERFEEVHEIPLDTLVSHLLAAKRSLSSVSIVHKANHIVTSARAALEESVVLSSRTGFLRQGILQQTRLLSKVRVSVQTVFEQGRRGFEDVIQDLDAADNRLQQTMNSLRATIVDSAFRPVGEEPRSLLYFIDETAVELTRAALKDTIDESQDVQSDFLQSIKTFDEDLRAIKTALSPLSASVALELQAESPLPSHLNTLETHAFEMASLLSSLISHFDLCTTAIRQTDGGLSAVRDVTTADPALPSYSGVIGSQSSQSLTPLTSFERNEMFTVLATDAAEVDDVVAELHSHLANIQDAHAAMQNRLTAQHTLHSGTVRAVHLLEALGAKLPLFITASQSFLAQWADIKASLATQMEELDGMRAFYVGYASSYDSLIIEVARRRRVEDDIARVWRKATERVKEMRERDLREREGFRSEVGEYLPGDIWAGLQDDGGVASTVDDERSGKSGGSFVSKGLSEAVVDAPRIETPQLKSVVVEAAVRREAERTRGFQDRS